MSSMDSSYEIDGLYWHPSAEDDELLNCEISYSSYELPAFPSESALEEFNSCLLSLSESIFSREGLMSCASLLASLSSTRLSDNAALVKILKALRPYRLLPTDHELRQPSSIALVLAGLVGSLANDDEDDPRKKRIVWVGLVEQWEEPSVIATPTMVCHHRELPESRPVTRMSLSSVGSRKYSANPRRAPVLSAVSLGCANFRSGCSACRLPRHSNGSTSSNEVGSDLPGSNVGNMELLMDISDTEIIAASTSFDTKVEEIEDTRVAALDIKQSSKGEVRGRKLTKAKSLSTSGKSNIIRQVKAHGYSAHPRHNLGSIAKTQRNTRALSLSSSVFNIRTNDNTDGLAVNVTGTNKSYNNRHRPYSVYSPPIVVKQSKKRATISVSAPAPEDLLRTHRNTPGNCIGKKGTLSACIGASTVVRTKKTPVSLSSTQENHSTWRP